VDASGPASTVDETMLPGVLLVAGPEFANATMPQTATPSIGSPTKIQTRSVRVLRPSSRWAVMIRSASDGGCDGSPCP
jgi:hypothetical protein